MYFVIVHYIFGFLLLLGAAALSIIIIINGLFSKVINNNLSGFKQSRAVYSDSIHLVTIVHFFWSIHIKEGDLGFHIMFRRLVRYGIGLSLYLSSLGKGSL